MALTDTKIRSIHSADRVLKFKDSAGLYLHVNTNGSKLWRMAYRFTGKQKTLSFGAYPEVSLLGKAKYSLTIPHNQREPIDDTK